MRLPHGEPLSQLDVDAQQLQRAGRLVAIMGDTSSGKSTLLCSLYDRYLRGAFADRSFVASTTLGAFEKLAHLSRAVSGARTPDTKRTYVSDGLQYYHLALVGQENRARRVDLFLSDRAGETYRSAMDHPDAFVALPELSVARVVTLLIDGARLAQPEELHEVLGTAGRMVRAMLDSCALNDTQHLHLVVTKRDEVERSENRSAIEAQVKSLVHRLRTNFGPRLATIQYFAISARDPKGEHEPADGCDALLSAWIDAAEPRVRAVEQNEGPATEFDRLATIERARA
ncbi:hypothetical protein CH339_14920 [Rhodobium orientis]|uniref:Double-GTPase 2 domain-containing protein n=1 Tax=Rhodobium orientis TaxID=34017 RepID=A0A327JLL2_9HYPH|nr:hypothetical protein CH339_14920 [Rhodobium orientis]